MIAILTGDIINSRSDKKLEWLTALKKVLGSFGNTPKQWEIYRGDSFQLESSPADALLHCMKIKACIKQNKNLDVRIGIGLGTKTHNASHITESNGSAFIHSGDCFDTLKKTTLAIKSDDTDFDNDMNLMLELALLTIDNWPPATAKIISLALEKPHLNQAELAKELNLKAQSSISEALSRGGFEEMRKLLNAFSNKIEKLNP